MTPQEILLNHHIKRIERNKCIEVAVIMLKCSEPILKIVRYTGLSEEDVLELKNS